MVIADIPFVDGITRPVFCEPDGRQYVLDNYGDKVYGVWLRPDEVEPDVVVSREQS